MKNRGKIAAMLLMLIAAGSMSLSAQRGMRGMRPDSAGVGMMRFEHMRFQPGYGHPGMRQGSHHQGMGMYRTHGFGQQFPGMRAMESIPDLTDQQRKDIADLRGKQMAEMEKIRIDMQSKIKEMHKAHRAKVMSILTPEQKKWVEENTSGQPVK